MLKIAMLSSWHVHAEGYAQQFNGRNDAKVTVVWDEDPVKGKKFAESLSVDFEPDLDKVLARDDVDAVCVNAPTNIHREVMVKAANAGKHIFTEKVLALTIEDCEAIKAAVEKNNVKFCISFPHRTLPHNLLAKKVVEDKILGKITLFRVRNAHNGASADWLPPHFYNEEQCGGGAMIDLGAHPMYLVRWLMGKPAQMSSAFTKVTDHAVEDNAVCIMKYDDGAIAISETGFVSGASPFILEMYGTDGTFIVNAGKVSIASSKITTNADYSGFVTPNQMPQPLPNPVSQFVDGVLYNKEIIFGMQDAIELTEMMVAAYKAHEQNGFVTV
ncbi:MAG: Gfo/Idh/MocA family oxidoreductase [Firmicutes bacterium]|nr:Gfo/Idh/MocA family oxidoreductase [Bacillota bacterium]